VIVTLLCAFFSIFTGGSGVTILALGILLLQALRADGYREEFSVGLITGSGSVLRAVWAAKFELALPVLVLVLFLNGLATLLEVAALTALYAFVVETLVHRESELGKNLWRILRDCGALLGGVMIILCAANGLSNYFVDAQIPSRLLAWVQASVHSPWIFLLFLNVFLLVVGCFLDIFSATFVVVPLILPLGAAYGIDPVHLGIIFIANLEFGYLTPPIGLNLFLASYRFDRPLLLVARASLPMLFLLGIGVLLITYVPGLTTALLD
jgi:tripartite ATP-independent transporter DctM subunit